MNLQSSKQKNGAKTRLIQNLAFECANEGPKFWHHLKVYGCHVYGKNKQEDERDFRHQTTNVLECLKNDYIDI